LNIGVRLSGLLTKRLLPVFGVHLPNQWDVANSREYFVVFFGWDRVFPGPAFHSAHCVFGSKNEAILEYDYLL